MPARPAAHCYKKLAQKWRDLARRRRGHFIELYQSGRWKHYYTETEFVARIREAVQATEEWERLAARPELTKAG